MKNWTKKKKVIVGGIAALAIFAGIGNMTGTEEEAPTAAVAAPEATEAPAPPEDTQEKPEAVTEAPVPATEAPEPEPAVDLLAVVEAAGAELQADLGMECDPALYVVEERIAAVDCWTDTSSATVIYTTDGDAQDEAFALVQKMHNGADDSHLWDFYTDDGEEEQWIYVSTNDLYGAVEESVQN